MTNPSMHIAKPCHEDWERMTAQDRGRHCDACDKTVIDVTAMTPGDSARYLSTLAEITATGQRVCVRAQVSKSGAIRPNWSTQRLLTNGIAAVLAMTVAGCSGDPDLGSRNGAIPPSEQPQVQQQNPEPLTGDVAAPEPENPGNDQSKQPVELGEPSAPTDPVPREWMGIVARVPASEQMPDTPVKGEVAPPKEVPSPSVPPNTTPKAH